MSYISKKGEEKNSFQLFLSCWDSIYGINLFTVGKYYAVDSHEGKETNMLDIHIKDFNQLLIALCLSKSFSLFSLSVLLSLSFSTYVICQSPISMSWRHLYSRQTQGGMCWWLSVLAIYHLSSFCPLRR